MDHIQSDTAIDAKIPAPWLGISDAPAPELQVPPAPKVRLERVHSAASRNRERYLEAFDIVTGLLGCMTIGTKAARHCFSKGRPTQVDWRCDVELAAKRLLTARDMVLFRNSFVLCTVPAEKIPVQILNYLKLALGAAWFHRGLSKTNSYFRSKTI